MSSSSASIKILVLHGFRDAGQRRLEQMRSLTRKLKGVSFQYLDAPYSVTLEEEQALPRTDCEDGTGKLVLSDNTFAASAPATVSGLRKWWSLRKDSIFDNPCFDTLDASLEHVRRHLETSSMGPFDGILGFSQGAVLAACVLLDEKLQAKLTPARRPRFGIFVGGFAVSDTTFLERMNNVHLTTPTLHVMGERDSLVPPSASHNLIRQLYGSLEAAKRWVTVCEHPGGHYVPSTAVARALFQEWIDKRRERGEGALKDVDITDMYITNMLEQQQIIYDRLDRFGGNLKQTERDTLLQNALRLEMEITKTVDDQVHRNTMTSSKAMVTGPLTKGKETVKKAPRVTRGIQKTLSVSVTTSSLYTHPLEALHRRISELEALMPPITEYAFGHIRYAAEYGHLVQVEARLAASVVYPAITSAGKHDHDQHVRNEIARLESQLYLLSPESAECHPRSGLQMELKQWRRVQVARYVAQ